MDLNVRTADEPRIRRLDGLVLLWVVLWLVIGGWVGYTLWQVSYVGDTVTASGRAIGSSGDALESLGGVPVVGDRTAELGNEVLAAGEDIELRGQEVKGQLRQLAVLLGLAVALLPATPVLGLYVPLRNARRRDIDGVRQLLSSSSDDGVVDRFLAERAVRRLSPREVHRIDSDPWKALSEGHTRTLADAELQRLGLRRRRPTPTP